MGGHIQIILAACCFAHLLGAGMFEDPVLAWETQALVLLHPLAWAPQEGWLIIIGVAGLIRAALNPCTQFWLNLAERDAVLIR